MLSRLKKVKMKKNSSNKGLLLPWLLKALNEQLYEGLKWSDRQRKIFYILWTHKSAEQWSKSDLEPFKAWAAHKGKLDGKNEKQLKATFRCALNSKKELKEVYRTRSKRFWQFVDSQTVEKDTTTKKRRKTKSEHVDDVSAVTSSENVENSFVSDLSSLRLSSSGEANISAQTSTKLPTFESFCSFASLTPPHQASEISFNSTDSKFQNNSEKETSRKEIFRLNPDLEDRLSPSTSHSNVSDVYSNSLSPVGSSYEAENSTAAMLPSFETFCSFFSLTPPPQKNEVSFNSTDYRTNYTPPPENNRLTPPQKHSQNTSHNSFHQSSTDVWQTNCWTTPEAQQEFTSLNQFFTNDFIEMYKSSNLELDNNDMQFLEMDDQHVPSVMDISQNNQIASRNGQHYLTYRTERRVDHFERMKLDDDYLLSADVDQEACEKIIQELDRLSPSESRIYSYNS